MSDRCGIGRACESRRGVLDAQRQPAVPSLTSDRSSPTHRHVQAPPPVRRRGHPSRGLSFDDRVIDSLEGDPLDDPEDSGGFTEEFSEICALQLGILGSLLAQVRDICNPTTGDGTQSPTGDSPRWSAAAEARKRPWHLASCDRDGFCEDVPLAPVGPACAAPCARVVVPAGRWKLER